MKQGRAVRNPTGIERLRNNFDTKTATRKSMASNRAKDTKLEIVFRKALWASGFRGYRKNMRGLPGTPDVVFTKKKLAIFLHGCYWHGCPHCRANRLPNTNRVFWETKLKRNKQRDDKSVWLLKEIGFTVLVLWECEIKRDLDASLEQVKAIINA